MKKRWVFLLLAAAIAVLPACNEGGGSIDDDYARLKDETVQGSAIESSAANTPIPKSLDYVVVSESGGNDLAVKAEVVSNGSDMATVFGMEVCDINDDYLKELAASIFDNGEYTVEKPYYICDDSELNALMTELSEGMDQNDKVLTCPEAIAEIQILLAKYNVSRVQEMTEDQVIVHVENTGITYRWGNNVTDRFDLSLDCALLKGTVDGKKYELCYTKYDHGTSVKLRTLEMVTLSDNICNLDSTVFEDRNGGNPCVIEESRELAGTMLERLGYDDFVEFSAAKRKCRGRSGDVFMDGYNIFYTREMNGVTNLITDNARSLTQEMIDTNTESTYGQEYVCIRIDHTGIIGVDFYYPCKLTGEVTTVELMNFEEIDAIAQDKIKEMLGKVEAEDESLLRYLVLLRSPIGDVFKVQFTYVPTNYQGKISYVPTWMYISQYDNSSDLLYYTNYFALIGVNAIDGSVTNYYFDAPLSIVEYNYYY